MSFLRERTTNVKAYIRWVRGPALKVKTVFLYSFKWLNYFNSTCFFEI